MDEKLQHFVALLYERAPPGRGAWPRPRKGGLFDPLSLAAAGIVLVLAGAAGGWLAIESGPLERAVPSVVVPPPAGSGVAPAVPPLAAAEQATAPADRPATLGVGDEASLAPSTIAPAPSDPEPALTVVPPPELASLPPSSAEKRGPAGTPLWLRYAVPAPPSNGLPRVVLVIDDMGLDRKRSDRAVALPGPLTLSFLPYAKDVRHQTEAAHRAGHELMVHVPMEPFGHVADAWPDQLEVSLSHEEVLRCFALSALEYRVIEVFNPPSSTSRRQSGLFHTLPTPELGRAHSVS